MRYSFVADHFCYLASIGPIALACALGVTAARRLAVPPAARVVTAGVLVAALSAAAWNRAEVFRGPEKLWTDTLERNPAAWLAHNNLGARRAMEGRDREADAHFREVLVLKPDHAGARANLGRLALRRGEISEALRWLEEAVRLEPDDVPARISLGDARFANGAPDDARRAWVEVLRIEPRNPVAHQRLGMLRLAGGEPAAAAEHLRVAARVIPNDPTVRIGLGTALARASRYREAAEELRVAVALDPDNVDARLRLAAALGVLGDLDGSEAQFLEVLRLDTGSEPARRGLDRLRQRRDRGGAEAGGSRIEGP
jgi:Flp pilus assembly protein TadD